MESDPPPEDFDYGERREDGQFENYPTVDEGELVQDPRAVYIHEECGTATRMDSELQKSVARDPEGYTHTFCAGCGEHVPVEEVRWKKDGRSWVVGGENDADDS